MFLGAGTNNQVLTLLLDCVRANVTSYSQSLLGAWHDTEHITCSEYFSSQVWNDLKPNLIC